MKIIFIIALFPIFTFSQNLSLKIGAEYRITPIRKLDKPGLEPKVPVFYSDHKQLTGTSFSYTLSYLFKNNFGIGFTHSFQYSHIYYENSDTDLLKSHNGIITDFELFIIKEIPISNKNLYIKFGGALMNNGTTYAYKEHSIIQNTNTEIIYEIEKDFSYTALNAAIGVNLDKFDIGAGMYIANASENFNSVLPFKLPYIKINYTIL